MAQPPRVSVVGATVTESTDRAASIDIALALANPNDEPLPLIEFDYTVSLNGKRMYEGRQAALATLSKGAERTLTVPAVVFTSETDWRPGATAAAEVAITGTLRYRTPGTFADLLFDIGVRKPKVHFAGQQPLQSP